MAYTSATMNSATPALTFIGILDGLILAITGMSKVSSAIVVGTMTWNVYKSAAANNSLGADYYYALGYITATPVNIVMTMFEGWNTGTLLASNYAPNTTSVIPTVTTWANPGAPLALPSTGTTMAYMQQASPFTISTNVNYFVSVTADRLLFGWLTTAAVNEGFYLGIYEPQLTSTLSPFPICAVRLGVSAAVSGSAMNGAASTLPGLTTREPGQTATATTNFGCGCAGSATNIWTNILSAGAELYTGVLVTSRYMVMGRASNGFLGLLKGLWAGPSQINNGDTISWVLAGTPTAATRVGVSSFGVYIEQV